MVDWERTAKRWQEDFARRLLSEVAKRQKPLTDKIAQLERRIMRLETILIQKATDKNS